MSDGDAYDEFDGDALLMRDEIERLRRVLAWVDKLASDRSIDAYDRLVSIRDRIRLGASR